MGLGRGVVHAWMGANNVQGKASRVSHIALSLSLDRIDQTKHMLRESLAGTPPCHPEVLLAELLPLSDMGKQNSCESVKWFELLPFPFLPTDDDGRLERLRRGEACACGCLSGRCLARKMITRDIDVLLMKIERCECGLIVRRSSRLPQHARLVAAGEVIAERRSLTACRLEHAGAA